MTRATATMRLSSSQAGQRTAGLIKEKKLLNIEHRKSNIEHRIMYSVYF